MPLKGWIKSALDHVIQVGMNEPGLEFVWVGDDAVDPLQQAQTLNILVSAGIKTREEARAELGLGGGGRNPFGASVGLEKFNPYHDEQGRFATGDNTTDRSDGRRGKPRASDFNVASLVASVTDAGDNGPAQSADLIPICIATGISIATDQYGNRLSTCHYECFSGHSFTTTFRGGGGCPPILDR